MRAGGVTIVPTTLFSCQPAKPSQTHTGIGLTQPREDTFEVRVSALVTPPMKHLHREQMIVFPTDSSDIPIARLQLGQRTSFCQAVALGYSARHAGQTEISGPSIRSPANPQVGQPPSSVVAASWSVDATHPRTRSSSVLPSNGRSLSLPVVEQPGSTLMARSIPQLSGATYLLRWSNRWGDVPPTGADEATHCLPRRGGMDLSIRPRTRLRQIASRALTLQPALSLKAGRLG
ncbi:hypothetical protein SAMN05444166_6417 [Singulisphaera sp. GP187]|nr:hypothetical protein SAMN05444166_6417 [Singulisphaera sp. GP187]